MNLIKHDFGNVYVVLIYIRNCLVLFNEGSIWNKLEILGTGVPVGDEREEHVFNSEPCVCV